MIVNKILHFAFSLFLCTSCMTCSAQEEPISPFTIIMTDKGTGQTMDLVDWLEHDVLLPLNNPCSSTFGFFFFKVTSSGEIDSLSYNGTLDRTISDRIKINIKKTEGFWKIPAGTSRSVSQWFMFPYFDFGKYDHLNSECPEKDKLLQKNLRELSDNLLIIFNQTKGRVTLIGVSQNRGPYIKI